MNPPITNPVATPIHEAERLRRWRLVLGGEADSSCGNRGQQGVGDGMGKDTTGFLLSTEG